VERKGTHATTQRRRRTSSSRPKPAKPPAPA
jgi:hypothetical protein